MGSLTMRVIAVVAAAALLSSILIPLSMASGHAQDHGSAMPMPCASGSVCNMSPGCPQNCAATNDAESVLQQHTNPGTVGLLMLGPSPRAVGLKPQKPPPKLA